MQVPRSFFLVSVDGLRAPKFRHYDFEKALTEALRLRSEPGNNWRHIRVLQEIALIPASKERYIDFSQIETYTDVKVSVGFALDLMAKNSAH